MRGRRRRGGRSWLRIWFWCAALAPACAPTKTFSYRFEPRVTRDFVYEAHDTEEPLAPEELAVVLLPEGVTLFQEGTLYRSYPFGGEYRRGREKYVGPARVFLPPGRRFYDIEIGADEDERSVVPISIDLRPGHAYELRVTVTSDNVEWALIPVSTESYAREHAADRS